MKFCKIKRTLQVSSEPIYHMTVEKNHNFFANRLCVHNCGYRGIVKVILKYTGIQSAYIAGFTVAPGLDKFTFTIKRGDRIAQMLIKQVPSVLMMRVDSLNDTDRGANGLGSTGVK